MTKALRAEGYYRDWRLGGLHSRGRNWGPGFKDWERARKPDLGGLVSRPVTSPS